VPTYETLPEFRRAYARLRREERAAFRIALQHFIDDLRGRRFRKGLRVKGVRGSVGVFEMTWAPDGRATFHFGDEQRPGEPHVVWRRIGTHEILDRP
jgi:hypothetical protein